LRHHVSSVAVILTDSFDAEIESMRAEAVTPSAGTRIAGPAVQPVGDPEAGAGAVAFEADGASRRDASEAGGTGAEGP
jgi:hypothetical protein